MQCTLLFHPILTHFRFVAPSRATITRDVEKNIVFKKVLLKREIGEDIADHHTVSVTTDGGPSHDVNKTKKNSVTISRVSNKWVLKTDILSVSVAEGSQTGEVIRKAVKTSLDEFGYNGDWQVILISIISLSDLIQVCLCQIGQ